MIVPPSTRSATSAVAETSGLAINSPAPQLPQPAGGVILHDGTGLDENAIADVEEQVRGRLRFCYVRRGLVTGMMRG